MSNPTRRHFLGTTAAAAAALVSTRLAGRAAAQTRAAPSADPLAIELANEALNVVRGAGATYADARVGRYRRQTIQTRERQVSGVSDEESYGLGVRALVNGCWGFAATSTMTRAGVQKAAQEAVAIARASHLAGASYRGGPLVAESLNAMGYVRPRYRQMAPRLATSTSTRLTGTQRLTCARALAASAVSARVPARP